MHNSLEIHCTYQCGRWQLASLKSYVEAQLLESAVWSLDHLIVIFTPVFILHPIGVEAPSSRSGFPALSVMILGEKKLICFRSRPLLEPEKRTARFMVQGREAGAEPRARCVSI